MAVGITILSGARQGERLEFDLLEFRAGGDRACEVFFDPDREPAARGREALFRLDHEGWSVKNVGGGKLWVNDRSVESSSRLRSGDVVRLSPAGPDFAFNLLAHISARAALPAAPSAAAPWPAESDERQEHAWDSLNTPAAVDGEQDQQGPDQRGQDDGEAPRGPTTKQLALVLAVSAVVVLGLLVGNRAWRGGGEAAVVPGAELNGTTEAPSPPGDGNGKETSGAAKTDERAADVADDDDDDDDDLPIEPAPKDPWEVACDELCKAVFLLAVEEPKTQTQCPVGTATAIADQALLTSASVAVELTRWRRREWKLWAMNQKTGAKIEVVDQRVHLGYEQASGRLESQVYADLGVVTLATKYPHVADLAAPDDLNELDRGLPLACVGVFHDWEPLNRFQSYVPEMVRGKVYGITALRAAPADAPADAPAADAPLLLHMSLKLPMKVYGAPVVNQAGRVVGVYAESAADAAGIALNMQYVSIVIAAQLRDWLERRDETLWVPPTVPPEPAKETKPGVP